MECSSKVSIENVYAKNYPAEVNVAPVHDAGVSESLTEESAHFSEESDSQSEKKTEILEEDDKAVQLSESIFIYTDKKLTEHGNVFEGKVRSGVYGIRPCAIKFAQKLEDNVREAKILTKLGSHTHVISIIQSGVHRDSFEEHVYIALDKCHKQNLRQYFEHRKKEGLVYDVNVGLEYSKQIIAGMTYIHENLIFHKDMKPSNILLSDDRSTIKLADFGMSQELESTSSKTFCKHQFGTNGFRSPESLGNSWASLKSDIYSLGVVLYFVLTNGMSPFGTSSYLWTHNMKIGSIDVSHLLVSNPAATEHLIKLMLSQERCRRPSIWQVAQHPCWINSDTSCDFDYGYQEEKDESEVQISEKPNQVPDDSSGKETKGILQFLKEARKMGFGRSQSWETSIIIFGRKTKYLYLFDPTSSSITPMREYGSFMMQKEFTTVCIGEYIYVLMEDRSMYRLNYGDVTAPWERMADLIGDHGLLMSAVVASRSIIIAGGSRSRFTKSAIKYDPSQNRWEKLEDKDLSTDRSTNVASLEYVYCLGGRIQGAGITDRVERLNVVSQFWDEVAPMLEAKRGMSAVECRGKLFIAGGLNRNYQELNSVEKYDPDVNQWTIMKPMTMGRRGSWFRCHFIEGSIYAAGDEDRGIEKYDVEKDEWALVHLPPGTELKIEKSVVVKIMK